MRSFLSCLVLVACGGGQTPIEVVTVAPLRTPCQSFVQQMCLTMTPDFETAETLFFGIEGYDHRWGVEAELKIHREPVDPPLADGPSELIVVDEVLGELESITAPFDLTFPFTGSNSWFTGGGTTLDMLGTDVLCESAVCSAILDRQINSFSNFSVTLELTDDDQTLTALSVQ
jgi:hypothetical protein